MRADLALARSRDWLVHDRAEAIAIACVAEQVRRPQRFRSGRFAVRLLSSISGGR